ncbi:MAG: hypothetical protein ACJAXK_003188 [Yoonia sp.]|jgi:hypothetical protein
MRSPEIYNLAVGSIIFLEMSVVRSGIEKGNSCGNSNSI